MLLNKILLGMVVKICIEDPTDEIRSSNDEVEVAPCPAKVSKFTQDLEDYFSD